MSRYKKETVGGFLGTGYGSLTENMNTITEAFADKAIDFESVDGVKKVLKNDEYFNALKESLTEDYNENVVDDGTKSLSNLIEMDNTVKFGQLLENTRQMMLNEAYSSDLQPIAPLTIPLLKTHWITCKMKNVIKTEVPTGVVFMRSLEKRYIKDDAGNKYYYNDMLENMSAITNSIRVPVTAQDYTLPVNSENLIADTSGGQVNVDTLSRSVHIKEVTFTVDPGTGSETHTKSVMIKTGAEMSQANEKVTITIDDTLYEDRISMFIDHDTGEVAVSGVTGLVTAVKFGGHLSSENNMRTAGVGFDREDKKFSVEEIFPLNTGITKDYIQNHNSMYNQDAVSRLIKTMTDTLAEVKDQHILDYLDDSFDRIKTTDYGIHTTFSCTPAANYTGNPIEYRRSMLLDKVNKVGIALSRILKTEDLYITVAGNPLDVSLLKDINWTTQQNDVKGGIPIDYSFGLMNTNNLRYAVTSSNRISEGTLRFYLVPTDDKHMTYTHFEHSNIISNEYRGQNVRIPNIMVGSRFTTEELQGVQAQIDITGNDL